VRAVSSRLWDFARPEPPPDAARTALPWAAPSFAKAVADVGAQAVELDATVPEHRFEEVVRAVRDHGLSVLSLEALCPHPAELARHAARAGLVPLANPDESERRAAVKLHRRTIELAAEVTAPFVVVTAGRVSMPPELDTPPAEMDERTLRAFLARRGQAAPPFVDGFRFALDELVPAAERLDRTIAIAMSGALDAVPSFTELTAILADFRGAPIAAWIDLAGVWGLQSLGVRRLETWTTLGSSIAGVRWSDVRRGEERVPGDGDLDLANAAKLAPSAHAVLSLGAAHDHGRVREGLGVLRRIGVWTP
jgi:sugar phosphate isomerase/epimerase